MKIATLSAALALFYFVVSWKMAKLIFGKRG